VFAIIAAYLYVRFTALLLLLFTKRKLNFITELLRRSDRLAPQAVLGETNPIARPED
jgi:hypothetical protein